MRHSRLILVCLSVWALATPGCGYTGDNDALPLPDAAGDGEIRGTGSDDRTATDSAATATPSMAEADSDGYSMDAGAATSEPGSEMTDGEIPSDSVDGSVVGDGQGNVQPGTLTAGAWDDNLNYDRFTAYRAELLAEQLAGALPTTDEEHATAHDAAQDLHRSHDLLDVSLVIDATGSMGDEIRYLQTEFDALSESIEILYPQSQQRWSLVVYRDTTDEYVVRWFDFRDTASEFRQHLAAQAASGGGDYPEASDQALEAMLQLSWRTSDDVARLAFWVADAPHHVGTAQRLASAVRGAATADIHIYPVASSGVDELTELTMRSAAQLTGGRYLFLTDDSGVGGSHMEPTIPCYFVTKLDDAILRMVDIEMTGVYREPQPDEVIRTGGDPQDGACVLQSGESVVVF